LQSQSLLTRLSDFRLGRINHFRYPEYGDQPIDPVNRSSRPAFESSHFAQFSGESFLQVQNSAVAPIQPLDSNVGALDARYRDDARLGRDLSRCCCYEAGFFEFSRFSKRGNYRARGSRSIPLPLSLFSTHRGVFSRAFSETLLSHLTRYQLSSVKVDPRPLVRRESECERERERARYLAPAYPVCVAIRICIAGLLRSFHRDLSVAREDRLI